MTDRYDSDEERWAAVCARSKEADGAFVYSVRTTGVFCRPSCPSRRARRENVAFHGTAADAIALGFRSCLRCAPERALAPHVESMRAIAAYIDEHADEALTLDALARRAALSRWHFQRAFTAALGVSPAQYHRAARHRRFASALREGSPVLDAALDAGYRSMSRAYAATDERIAMTPSRYRDGGRGERIDYAVRETALGALMMAATERGVCFAQFGEDESSLKKRLEEEFPEANIARSSAADSPELDRWMIALEAHLSGRERCPEPPLDLRGTAFQLRVWRFLTQLKEGETRTYTQLAEAIGAPSAVRAAASACAANRVAVLVPCHRVLRGDGSLADYRWGVERKRALLEAERTASDLRSKNTG